MAQTRAEIYASLIAEKDRVAELSVLSDEKDIKEALSDFAEVQSNSKVAVWRLWCYVVSFVLWAQQKLWDLFKSEVEKLKATAYVHSDDWYADRMLAFQFGDTPIVDPVTKQVTYAVIDPAKQIISRVAVTGQGVTIIKVAKGTGDVAEPLTSAELTAATAYLDRIQAAGAQVGLISQAADLLKIDGDLYYDGTVTDIAARVEAAVIGFFRAIPFNAQVLRSDLVAAVRAVDGVFDFYLTTFEGKDAGGVYAPVGRAYFPLSGHVQLDPAFPISNLNLIAQ